MHAESKEPIVMGHVRISKLDVKCVESWFKVSFFINGKRSTKVDIKIFEFQLDSAIVWKPYGIS